MVKPSWTVMRFTEADGRRLEPPKRSAEPVSRVANSPRSPSVSRQKSRIVSRYLPFHSLHRGGNRPRS